PASLPGGLGRVLSGCLSQKLSRFAVSLSQPVQMIPLQQRRRGTIPAASALLKTIRNPNRGLT
ncbi:MULTISPECIES: hypothetical protein, partial [Pseudomonas aeruginosa group]|uniref:hypothetical protein n=1 Tax=Pseudomonas aeruginosa group TaxID=136841 RepID=UPI001C8C7B49